MGTGEWWDDNIDIEQYVGGGQKYHPVHTVAEREERCLITKVGRKGTTRKPAIIRTLCKSVNGHES